MRRTTIVATLGPASSDPEIIEQMIKAGLNGARLNYSHGSHEEHRQRLHTVREVSRRLQCDENTQLLSSGGNNWHWPLLEKL